MKRSTIENYAGFEYLSVNVPIRSSKFGDIIDVDPGKLELLVANTIIEKQIPIRGRELKYLRKVLGLSLEKFAREIDLSSTSIFKWEKSETERLDTINEVAVRSFIAERLGLGNKTFSQLKGTKEAPTHFELKAS